MFFQVCIIGAGSDLKRKSTAILKLKVAYATKLFFAIK